MTENPDDFSDDDKENDPPAGSETPDAVTRKTTEIINTLMSAGRWGTVNGSTIVSAGNNMWEFRINFQDNTTRRVRIGGDGGVFSDITGPTSGLH
jgi:hypothetical protein